MQCVYHKLDKNFSVLQTFCKRLLASTFLFLETMLTTQPSTLVERSNGFYRLLGEDFPTDQYLITDLQTGEFILQVIITEYAVIVSNPSAEMQSTNKIDDPVMQFTITKIVGHEDEDIHDDKYRLLYRQMITRMKNYLNNMGGKAFTFNVPLQMFFKRYWEEGLRTSGYPGPMQYFYSLRGTLNLELFDEALTEYFENRPHFAYVDKRIL